MNSFGKLENVTDVGMSRVQKTHKFNIVEHLHPRDAQRRIEFCTRFIIERNPI